MREAASRGFFLASNAPFGYKRVKVNDGVKERPTLEVDPATAPVVKEMFEKSLRGSGLKEICKELNDRGVTNRGKRWYKGTLHYVLRNEAYTGAAVWGRTSKGEKTQDPVRVEGAWPALISRELFDEVQQAMRDRAPKVRRPARVGTRFLLSGAASRPPRPCPGAAPRRRSRWGWRWAWTGPRPASPARPRPRSRGRGCGGSPGPGGRNRWGCESARRAGPPPARESGSSPLWLVQRVSCRLSFHVWCRAPLQAAIARSLWRVSMPTTSPIATLRW